MASLGHQLPKNPHPKQLRRTSKAYSFALSLNVATTHETPPGNASFWDCDSPDTRATYSRILQAPSKRSLHLRRQHVERNGKDRVDK
jgi:hypothetical protein